MRPAPLLVAISGIRLLANYLLLLDLRLRADKTIRGVLSCFTLMPRQESEKLFRFYMVFYLSQRLPCQQERNRD